MAHHTKFIVVHYDGYVQSIVGNPKDSRKGGFAEIERLVKEEGFEESELQLVQVPN